MDRIAEAGSPICVHVKRYRIFVCKSISQKQILRQFQKEVVWPALAKLAERIHNINRYQPSDENCVSTTNSWKWGVSLSTYPASEVPLYRVDEAEWSFFPWGRVKQETCATWIPGGGCSGRKVSFMFRSMFAKMILRCNALDLGMLKSLPMRFLSLFAPAHFFKGIICPVSTLASTAGSLPCRPSLPSQLVVLLLPFWQHRTLWHLWHPRHPRRHRSTVHSVERLEIPMGQRLLWPSRPLLLRQLCLQLQAWQKEL